MAQRNGNGVRRVVRPGDLLHMQKPPRHIHHLALFRLAVADDGLLDLHRCVLKQRDPRLGDGKQDHAAAMADADTCCDIMPPEQLLDRDSVRRGDLQQPDYILVQDIQPLGKRQLLIRRNDAVLQQPVLAPLRAEEAEARGRVTRVDP